MRLIQNRVSLFYILLLVLFPQIAEARYEHLIGKTYPERYKSLDSIFLHHGLFSVDSATAFQRLDSIKVLAKEENDTELVRELELMRCNYYTRGIQKNTPACGPCLEALLQKVITENNAQLQIRIRASLGYYYRYDVADYGLSLEHQLNSYYLVKDIPTATFPNKMEILAGIGGAYHSFGDYESGKRYLLESLKAGPSYKPWFNININNNLGLIYRNQGKYDSAIYFFRKTRAIAQASNSTQWLALADGNIGIAYYLQKRYEEAIPLLENNVAGAIEYQDLQSAATALTTLADINLHHGNISKARDQIHQARSLLDASAYNILKDLYPLLSRITAQSGNMALAIKYADSAIIAKDSFTNSNNTLVMARAQQHAEAEKYLADVQKLTDAKKFQTYQRNALLIFLVLLGAITLLFINRQKLAHTRKQEMLENEKLLVKADLSKAAAQLDAYTQSLHEKNELIEKFAADLENLKIQGNTDMADERERILQQLQETTILTEDEWKNFKSMFEKVHAGFLNRLRERLPDLSPAEIRFMVLTKLKLSNKEMAGILGISTDAVRMNRHRLRKKLNTTEEADIEELAALI